MRRPGHDGPPAFFEWLLRRAGRATRVGACAVEDLRREHAAWCATEGRAVAATRYALAASAVAARLWWEGRAAAGSAPGVRMRDLLWSDVRFGARALARSPGFTVTSALTFAIGVGATTAIFSVVHAILLRPLPYPDPERLARIEINSGGAGWYGSSMPEYFDYGDHLDAFESFGAWTAGDVTLGDTLAPSRVRVAFASASLLPTLGVPPAHGRVFGEAEDTPENNRYIVLGHALWVQAYGGDPALLGSTVPVNGYDFEVVGIMPPGFAFPDGVRAWVPYGMNPERPNPRMNHFLGVVGRLREGRSLAQAAAQLDAYTTFARDRYPEIYSERGFRARVRSLHESVVGDVRTPLMVLLAAVVLVLLIACVNVANLFLTRAEARQREFSVRAVLGASAHRLTRQLTTESLLLAGTGGLLGLGLAQALVRGLAALAPPSIPRLESVRVDSLPLAVALLVITFAGLAFGALPALRARRHVAAGTLARAGRGVVARRSGRRVRRALVASQVALACMVVVGAGLMLRTIRNLRALDAGFDAGGVLTAAITPDFGRYAEPARRADFWRSLTDRLAAIPGVRAAGAASALPLTDEFSLWSIRVEGRVTTSIGDAPDSYVAFVTPGAFDALGIALRRGRTFTAADRADSAPVVVVSESFAARFWPGRDPIGAKMKVFDDRYPWLDVVGVVADVRHDRLDAAPQPFFYVPHAQAENTYGTPLPMYAILRGDDPLSLVPAVRAAVRDIDPTTPVSRVRTVDALVAASMEGRSFTFDLLQAFALVAVLLACVGVYGVASLSVAERTGEIGVRKALGAHHRAVLGLVVRESLATVALGAGLGILAALAATRLMTALLFGVGGSDPATHLAALALLLVTALGAALVPALRALRIDPLVSLRNEV